MTTTQELTECDHYNDECNHCADCFVDVDEHCGECGECDCSDSECLDEPADDEEDEDDDA